MKNKKKKCEREEKGRKKIYIKYKICENNYSILSKMQKKLKISKLIFFYIQKIFQISSCIKIEENAQAHKRKKTNKLTNAQTQAFYIETKIKMILKYFQFI